MSSHPFDELTRRTVTISRRSVLRWLGASTVGMIVAGARARSALAVDWLNSVSGRPTAPFDIKLPPLPPAEPWSPQNPPNLDDIIDDYLDCITQGRTPEECDRGFPGFAPFDWCQIVWDIITGAIPTLAGLISTFTPFSRNCGERDCFQCCYVARTGGCGSSYIGFPVINCNDTNPAFGAGTKAVGLTFVLDPDSVEPDDSCLFIPQVCAHIAQCVESEFESAELAKATVIRQPQAGVADNYLTHPRAIDQRARYFALQVQEEVHAYLESYYTHVPEARPFHSLAEALTHRGRIGWRRDLTNTPIDITHPALRINDTAGNLNESASWANAAHLLGLARVLTGVPNLAARLEYVESRKWSQAEKDAYLSGVGDPYQALRNDLDAHWITILQRVMMLQDYALLAAPVPGELTRDGTYGGEVLGQAPALSLRATSSGAEITLTLSIDDAEDGAGGLARPVAVDWGDGHASHHSLPSGQRTLEVAHAYEASGRYVIYAVCASDSGLRGHAALVIEATEATPPPAAPSTLPAISRIHLSGLTLTNLLSTKRFAVEARLVDAAGQSFRAGRSAPASAGVANVPVAFGDLYAHNPARLETALLSLDLRSELTGPPSRVFSTYLSMDATMRLGVWATSTQTLVEQPVTLTPEMLHLYLAGASTPLPSTTVTVEVSGALRVPLFWRESSSLPWQKIVRIDIPLTTALFDGFDLDNTVIDAPVGAHRAWIEARPGVLTEVQATPWQVLLPRVGR